MVYVASGGLAMNIFGMFLFMGITTLSQCTPSCVQQLTYIQFPGHGGHGHSHGGHGHSGHGSRETKMKVEQRSDEEIGSVRFRRDGSLFQLPIHSA